MIPVVDHVISIEEMQAKAREIGFDVCGVARPEINSRNVARLDEFVAQGKYGTMSWMNDPERLPRRRDPKVLWPEVKSVIVLGMNYGPDQNPLAILEQKNKAAISVYARNKDYHDLIKKRLKQFARWIVEQTHGADEVKVFVDTAPVLEKPLAQGAGIGWQGKHSNLVSREFGSWLFLGEVFTTLDLPKNDAEIDHCGSCRKCVSACPTNAFEADYQLDARKCISYLTIEHDGMIPREFRKAMGNRIYGCDDCLAVCPWNKFAAQASEMALIGRDDLREPSLSDFLLFDDIGFRTFFSGSPIKRIGRAKFLRNVLVAAGNSDSPELITPVTRLLDDENALVRASAVWALSQLMEQSGFRILYDKLVPSETSDMVIDEWTNAVPAR